MLRILKKCFKLFIQQEKQLIVNDFFKPKICILVENMQKMLIISDALDIPLLKILCEKFLLKRTSKWDIVLKFKYADHYNLITFKVFLNFGIYFLGTFT